MATGPGYPSSTSVYIPNFEASGKLITGHSRNPKKYPLAKYVQYVKSDKPDGYYMQMGLAEQARVVNTQDYRWAPGGVRPTHEDGLERFTFKSFRCERYDYGFVLDWTTKKTAVWDIIPQHQDIHAAKLMTSRTIRMLTPLLTTSTWTTAGSDDFDLDADHTATATALAGGQLNLGTSSAPYIKIALDKIAVVIHKSTMGVVEHNGDNVELMVIINPNQARLWAESSEIHEYIKGSYWAKEELADGLHPNNKFGLPSNVYGYPILIEGTVRESARKGATSSRSYVMEDQKMLVVSRVGGLEGVAGGPSFSTATIFHYADEDGSGGEMTIETWDDARNKRTEVHVNEFIDEVVTSVASGYLLTATTSVAS